MLINTGKTEKIPKNRVFGYVDEAEVGFFFFLRFFFWIQSHTGSLVMENMDLQVRVKAHGQDEDWASVGYLCLHLCSFPGCGRARLCSPETRRDSFH